MQNNVGQETAPEGRLRIALSEAGASFLTDCRPEPEFRCKADFVFPEARICVFVDGCFWHRCPDHFAPPTSNSAWWKEKIAATVARDSRQTEQLTRLGWKVVRVWEHETTPTRVHQLAERIVRLFHDQDG